MLRAVSSVFKFVRDNIWFQLKVIKNQPISSNQTRDIYDSKFDDYVLLEKEIHELEEAFDKKHQKYVQQIIYIFNECVGSYNMNNNSDLDNRFVAKNESERASYYLKNTNQTETYYEQSGKLGIGHVSGGEFKDNVKIAAEINEAEKQNLANAATEIQQLLEQLSETYPTTSSKEKNIVVGEAVDQIENNPTLKAKVVNALKAGGTEAFKEAINHPLVNILVASIEGWQDAE